LPFISALLLILAFQSSSPKERQDHLKDTWLLSNGRCYGNALGFEPKEFTPNPTPVRLFESNLKRGEDTSVEEVVPIKG
jgi:hypothetical protein